MSHPLLDVENIQGAPGPYLESIGNVFATFGVSTQDSGNVSYGLQIGDERYFVKTTNPMAEAFATYPERVEMLYNAARLRQSCDHATLPILHHVIESAHGPMLVYDWVDGELLQGKNIDPQSPHQRFRQLPVEEILNVLDSIFEVHLQLVNSGWIAVDFYDSSIIYDFVRRKIHIVDLDNYRHGPFQNNMGRMFGSSRFMAPEEFEFGADIDERTTLFTMGRTAAIFLSDNSLERAPFRGSDTLYEVVVCACQESPGERYQSMSTFYGEWQKARKS